MEQEIREEREDGLNGKSPSPSPSPPPLGSKNKLKGVVLMAHGSGHVNPVLGLIHELVHKHKHKIVFYNVPRNRFLVESTCASFASFPGGDSFSVGNYNLPDTPFCLQLIYASESLIPIAAEIIQSEKPDYVIYDFHFFWARYVTTLLDVPAICVSPMLLGRLPYYDLVLDDPRSNQIAEKLKHLFGIEVDLNTVMTNYGNCTLVFSSKFFQPSSEEYKESDGFYFTGPQISLNAEHPCPICSQSSTAEFEKEFREKKEPSHRHHHHHHHHHHHQHHHQHQHHGEEEIGDERELIEKKRLEREEEGGKVKEAVEEFLQRRGDGDRKGQYLIFMSMGTLYRPSEAFLTPFFEAFSLFSSSLVIINVGQYFDIESRKSPNILFTSFAPQLYLLERADVFVTHAGLNSLTEACCCAVPMLLIPKFGDQPRNAERAQELGAGILLARSQYEDAECIRESVIQLAENPSYKKAASKIGLSFAHFEVETEEELMEIHKSIPPKELQELLHPENFKRGPVQGGEIVQKFVQKTLATQKQRHHGVQADLRMRESLESHLILATLPPSSPPSSPMEEDLNQKYSSCC